MGTASGTVKFKDNPIPSGMLYIFNKETANADASEIKDGHFALGGEVPVGTYTVFVTAIPPEPGSPLERPKNFDGGGFPDVPQKYQMQDQSDLTVEIQEGKREVEIVIPAS